ncbi:MAG TPA: NAD(P)-binding protein [Phytomonospora sp.]
MRDVVVIGAGFAGIGMAVALKRAARHDFVVLERAGGLGDTWSTPGGPAAFPSYSFESYADWSRGFAVPPGFGEYLRHCADEHEVKPHIRFGAEAASAVYDESAGAWSVATADGGGYSARALVAASPGLAVSGPLAYRLDGDDLSAGAIESRIRSVAADLSNPPAPGAGAAHQPRTSVLGGLRTRLRRLLWSVGGCAGWYLDRHGGRPGQ